MLLVVSASESVTRPQKQRKEPAVVQTADLWHRTEYDCSLQLSEDRFNASSPRHGNPLVASCASRASLCLRVVLGSTGTYLAVGAKQLFRFQAPSHE
jgi:hypothetical protein